MEKPSAFITPTAFLSQENELHSGDTLDGVTDHARGFCPVIRAGGIQVGGSGC